MYNPGVFFQMKKWTVLDLLAKANDLLDSFQPDLALSFCEKALKIEPNNILVLQTLSSILLELGQVDQALKHLEQCAHIEPESGYEKFLALGQISTEREALNWYSKGFEILSRESQIYEMNEKELKQRLCSILCSQAELWMTDLCMEAEAEMECEKVLIKAREIGPEEPEVLRLLSDFYLAKCQSDNAKREAVLCFDLISNMNPTDPNYPSFDLRTSLTRNLIELEEYEKAKELLKILSLEDDKHLGNFYLYALVSYYLGNKEECLGTCDDLLKELEKINDPDLVEATQELMEKANSLE